MAPKEGRAELPRGFPRGDSLSPLAFPGTLTLESGRADLKE